jgi:DNA recombination protein RmuC
MTPIIYTIIGIVGGAFFVFLVFQLFKSKDRQPDQYTQLSQRLDNLGGSINQALRDTVKMVAEQLKDSRESVERSTQAVHQQAQGFASGLTRLSENVKQVHESVKNVSSFQDMLRAPKLRGQWGEMSLEASLGQYFSKDSYELQHYFGSGEAVDAVLRLPNDLLLPIDSKFNWENFQKMVNAENDIQKEQYKKAFFSNVRDKVDEISSKYILPHEGTTDFALMYIPAETVFYEIVNNVKGGDIFTYARSKKVWPVSPNTFGLSVSAIRHWVKDIQLTREMKNIMKRLDRISKDGHTLADDFRKLGKHLSNAQSSYTESEDRLDKMITKVENVLEIGEGEEKEIEQPKENLLS